MILRLQTVIRAANELDIDEMPENPEIPGEYRRQTEGLVYGASAAAQSEPNRFYHNKLNFHLCPPTGLDGEPVEPGDCRHLRRRQSDSDHWPGAH